eukprot:362412-Chlamydomonas_euryale.AAC.2
MRGGCAGEGPKRESGTDNGRKRGVCVAEAIGKRDMVHPWWHRWTPRQQGTPPRYIPAVHPASHMQLVPLAGPCQSNE